MYIKEFAERFNVQPDTIRYYEKEGILYSKRQMNGYRIYDESSEKQLKFVLVLKQVGFTIKEIQQLLQLKGKPISVECNVNSVGLFQDKIANVEEKIEFYRFAIEALKTAEELIRNGKYAENEGIIEEMILNMFQQSRGAKMNG